MKKGVVAVVVLLVAVIAAAVWWMRGDGGAAHFTGFVEGEERVIRSEVAGRVLEVAFAEGAAVPADAVVARIDESDIAAKIVARQRELDVTRADIETQSRRIGLVESTWKTGVDARRAEVAQAESALVLAERTFAREAETGIPVSVGGGEGEAESGATCPTLEKPTTGRGNTQFASETAAVTGKSKTAVNKAIRRATAVCQEARDLIREIKDLNDQEYINKASKYWNNLVDIHDDLAKALK